MTLNRCIVGLLLFALPVAAHGQTETLLRFPPDAVVDITQPPYSAVPNDDIDDTAAIQRAVTDNVGTGRFIYFPAGTYLVSKPIEAKNKKGLWEARLVLIGESREKTILRLADHSSAFADPQHPASVISTGSVQQQGDSPDGGGNKAFGNYILNLTIHTGSDNPGAIGVNYAVSNFGAIENVNILHDENSSGVAAISMRRIIPGPGLIKNVMLGGFNVGLDIGDVQYGMTLENIMLIHQRLTAIRDYQNLLHIHNLSSLNTGPAFTLTDVRSCLTLLNAHLTGQQNAPAITGPGFVTLRDISNFGYSRIADRQTHTASTLLPIEPTPDFYEPDLSQWIIVGPRKPGENDDTAAIQRAIDSGKRVVYFRNDRTYFTSDTIVIRGAVRQIIGFGSEISLGAAKQPFSGVEHPRPLFRIDRTSHPQLILEHLFFNAQYPGEVIFENNSPVDVAIKHCAGWVGANGHRHSYRNTANATGKLFIEDVFLPGWHFTNQQVWARQLNPENPDGDGVEPQVLNEGAGGKLWILGFKTEGPAPFITTRNGAVTELLGAYNYISATAAPQVPADAVPYIIDHATASLTFATDNFRDSDYRTYIRVIRDGQTIDIPRSQLPPRNGTPGDRSVAVPLFRSDDITDGQ